MHFRDIFLFFVAVVTIGLSYLKIFPEWVIYIGLGSLVLMGIRLAIQAFKRKVAATPFRPSIQDLEYQRQKKAEMEARKKFVADEMKRSQQTDTNGETGFQ